MVVTKTNFTNDRVQTPNNGGAVELAGVGNAMSLTSDAFSNDDGNPIFGAFNVQNGTTGLFYPPSPPPRPPSPPPRPPFPPLPPGPPAVPSCTGRPNGVVTLPSATGPFEAYCVSGFVLLAKIDGRTQNWAFQNSLWTDGTTFNAGSLSLVQAEAKFPAYNRLSISSLRVRARPAACMCGRC